MELITSRKHLVPQRRSEVVVAKGIESRPPAFESRVVEREVAREPSERRLESVSREATWLAVGESEATGRRFQLRQTKLPATCHPIHLLCLKANGRSHRIL